MTDPTRPDNTGAASGSGARPGRRILFIAPVMPSGTGGGLAMRCGVFLEAASALGKVDVLITPIARTIDATDVAYTRRHAARLIVVESEGRPDSLMDMILHSAVPEERLKAFASYGRPAICFNLSSPVLRDAGHAVAGKHYDLCVVMRLYSLPVLQTVQRSATLDRIVCDLDDDDAQLALEMAENARERGDDIEARWHRTNADNFNGFLEVMGKTANRLTVASPLSLERLAATERPATWQLAPNSIALADPAGPVEEPRLLFVGTLNYKANEEGLSWFLAEVLPRLRREMPNVEMRIAGRQPGREMTSRIKAARARLLENLPDLEEVYRSSGVVLVPLLNGSGTRIKILEAGAYGLPVVSTRKGAEGLGLQDGVHAWITAPDPDAFAAACLDALRHPEKRAATARHLRRYVMENHERGEVLNLLREMFRAEIEGRAQ